MIKFPHIKNTILILFVLLLISSCNQATGKRNTFKIIDSVLAHDQQKSDKQTDSIRKLIKSEDWIFDTILSLEEVKERAEYIEKQTNGERHLSVTIVQSTDSTGNYYWVKAGEDNGTNFVTHFNFYVYSHPRKIMFFDTVNDTILNLQAWRKTF